MKVFNKIKVSYLIVGHTHEDPDQSFSHIGRYFRKVVQTILSVPAFIAAIMTCFKTPASIPKCVENISFCYDTTSLRKILDKDFACLTYQNKLLTSATTLLFRETKKVVLACNTSTNVILMPFCLVNLMSEVPISLQPTAIVQSYNAHQKKMSSQRKNSGITLSGMSPTTLYSFQHSKYLVLKKTQLILSQKRGLRLWSTMVTGQSR